MATFLQDVRYSLRVLMRNRSFSLVAVLSLALGIGANTSMFSVVSAVLLRPLPFPEPHRLITAKLTFPKPDGGVEAIRVWSYPKFREVKANLRAFESLSGFVDHQFALSGAGIPERIAGEAVSADYFRTLGVKASLGRVFVPEEDRTPGTHPVVLLGHGLWQRRFGADPDIIGRTVLVERLPLTVIGILPPGFRGLTGTGEMWTPLAMLPALSGMPRRLEMAQAHWLNVVGRLSRSATLEQASSEVRSAADSARASFPNPKGWGIEVQRLHDASVDPVLRRLLLVLLGAVACVLLIACANIANLTLARGAARKHEVALRLAVGAGRWRLVRQLLTESLVIGVLGGVCGLFIALWGVDMLASFKPGDSFALGGRPIEIPALNAVRLDGAVLGFNFTLALAAVMVFGLAPAIRASRVSLVTSLKHGGAPRLWRMGPGALLVAGEVALALVLVTGAGLMLNSMARLLRTPIGFEPQNVLSFRVSLPLDLKEPAARAFQDALLQRAAALPGVEAAETSSSSPLARFHDISLLSVPGRGEERIEVGIHTVSPGLFGLLRIPVLRGRGFTAQDSPGAPWVALLSRTTARKLFGASDPVGRTISLAMWDERLKSVQVIGVAGDVQYGNVQDSLDPQVYLCSRQLYTPFGLFFVRAKGSPDALASALRREVAGLDRNLPVFDVVTMEQRYSAAMARTRFTTVLLGCFAVLALALAAVGIYGVIAYNVSRRGREVGIRMALGAGRGGVLRMVLKESLWVTWAGIAAGSVGSLALTRFLSSQLYEVRPNDPLTFASTAVVLTGVALAATWIPARRAARVDPMAALRYE
ncbi:MAG TPA: ABC transporter permease [Bryobacteraceae bacterium]|nr:ABC transporter permease [Bryobacteraceae bacterium]